MRRTVTIHAWAIVTSINRLIARGSCRALPKAREAAGIMDEVTVVINDRKLNKKIPTKSKSGVINFTPLFCAFHLSSTRLLAKPSLFGKVKFSGNASFE